MSALEDFPRITPFLWFDSNAEEAVEFYLSIFPNSRRLEVQPVVEGMPGPHGSILTVAFELDGQIFTALNGGPVYRFNEAVSFVVRCDSQPEVDYYWSKLSAGGVEIQCGWLKDRFGLTWQIVPARLPDLIRHPKASGDARHEKARSRGARTRRAILRVTGCLLGVPWLQPVPYRLAPDDRRKHAVTRGDSGIEDFAGLWKLAFLELAPEGAYRNMVS
jgi:predicted 3-demethylubiquinone-9 3-methyltransferase (glyoxalase superfamily)